jgi:hypothetical protein
MEKQMECGAITLTTPLKVIVESRWLTSTTILEIGKSRLRIRGISDDDIQTIINFMNSSYKLGFADASHRLLNVINNVDKKIG